MKNTQFRYGWVAQWLHWGIAALIVLQYLLINLVERAEESGREVAQLALLANHKSTGITILMLAIIRLGWRLYSPPPALGITTPRWQRLAAHGTHRLLYILIFALPISGWLMSSAAGYSVSWFNLLQLPDLVPISETSKDILELTHEILATALFVLALIHLSAALKHALIDRDDTLRRMSSRSATALFIGLIGAGYWILGNPLERRLPIPADSQPVYGAGNEALNAPATASAGSAIGPGRTTISAGTQPALWKIDYETSQIEFQAEQAGASFQGQLDDWQADIRFDPTDLQHSEAQVTINVNSIGAGDAERDETLQSPEWFHSEIYPTVQFRTQQFALLPDGRYRANATLTIKNQEYPIVFEFTLHERGDKYQLQGHCLLDRLMLKLGTGDWADTTWIGQKVPVDVLINAAR